MKSEKRVREILKRCPKNTVDEFIKFCNNSELLQIDSIENDECFSTYYKPASSELNLLLGKTTRLMT